MWFSIVRREEGKVQSIWRDWQGTWREITWHHNCSHNCWIFHRQSSLCARGLSWTCRLHKGDLFVCEMIYCVSNSMLSSLLLCYILCYVVLCHTSIHGVALVRLYAVCGLLKIQDAKKSPKSRHLATIAQLCRAISSQLRHVSTIGKKLFKQQYFLQMSPQYGELRPTSSWDLFTSLGHPS